MVYVLIVTTMFYGFFQKSPVALSKVVISGFTTEQACNNAGLKEQAQSKEFVINGDTKTLYTTFTCSPLSV